MKTTLLVVTFLLGFMLSQLALASCYTQSSCQQSSCGANDACNPNYRNCQCTDSTCYNRGLFSGGSCLDRATCCSVFGNVGAFKEY